MEISISKHLPLRSARMMQGLALILGLSLATIFFFAIKLVGHDVNMGGRGMGLKIGVVFPEFSFPDLSGRMVNSKEYRGKNTLVMFLDPGCPFCKKLLPLVRDISSEENSRISLVIVSSGKDSANKTLAKEYKLSFPVLRVDRKLLGQRYKVSGVPFMYLLDKRGVIIEKQGGTSPDSEKVLRRMVEKVY